MESLRELSDDYIEVLNDCYNEEFVSDELIEKLRNINEKWEAKLQNLIYVLKEIETKSQIVNEEIDRLIGRSMCLDKNIKSIKQYMTNEMIATGKTKFETPLYTLNLRKSEPVEVEREFVEYAVKNNLKQFLRVIPEKIEPDKTAIKEHIRAGNKLKLKYAQIKENQNLNIR